MQCDSEHLTDALCADMSGLVKRYYAVTPAHTGLPPYDFNWPAYQALDEAGQILALTVRDHGELVAFALYLIIDHPHHKGWLVAECDTLAVDHTMRGKGIGKYLCEAGQEYLRDRGVKMLTHRYRTCYGVEPLFASLGFTCEEHVYAKEL